MALITTTGTTIKKRYQFFHVETSLEENTRLLTPEPHEKRDDRHETAVYISKTAEWRRLEGPKRLVEGGKKLFLQTAFEDEDKDSQYKGRDEGVMVIKAKL
ncbi:hypothetical protein EDD11_000081 [Mortierella claussenii]|nr:hypothetical protein EDD11_000081 [Mortierella claussenii]